MQVIESYIDIYKQYFENNVLILILACIGAICILIKLKKREDKRIFIIIILLAIFVCYNEIIFQITGEAKEDASYYRLFWGIPIVIFAAYPIFCVTNRIKTKIRLIVIMLFFICTLIAGNNISLDKESVTLYNLSQNVIDIANYIDQEREWDFVNLAGDFDATYGIREYNAHINLPFGENILFAGSGQQCLLFQAIQNNTNISADQYDMLEYELSVYHIDYVAVKKEFESTNNALKSLDKELVYSNKIYNIYKNENFERNSDEIQVKKQNNIIWKNCSAIITLAILGCGFWCIQKIERRKEK